MNRYVHHTPATDTHELRSDLRGPYFERDTVILPALDMPTEAIPFWQPRPHPPALPRRNRLVAALRKTGAVLLLLLGLMALSAVPAKANPLLDPTEPRYYGPTVTCWAADQLFPWAFGEEGCR